MLGADSNSSCLPNTTYSRYNTRMKTPILLLLLCALLITGCTPFGTASAPTVTPVAPTTIVSPPTSPPAPAASPITIGGPTPTAPSATEPTSAAAQPSPAIFDSPSDPDPAIATIAANPRPLRDQVALARAFQACQPDPAVCPTVARTEPLELQVGYTRPFYVTDFDTNTQFEIEAELKYASPVVLMYVEQGLRYDQQDLERAAQTFEQEIYPRTREIFGSELQPGVDGDLRITILNANDPSGQVLGYFSSQDSLPSSINRYSNEREMFFMNITLMPFDDPEYLQVLAHEFQHMIHSAEQPGSALWFNEASSQLAEDLNGFVGSGFINRYLVDPDVQLNTWATAPDQSLAHYGASHLFLRYIYAQYAGAEQVRPLVQANAGHQLWPFVELAARTRPDITRFGQLVSDWAVANLLDDPQVADGRYAYDTGHDLDQLLPRPVQPQAISAGQIVKDTVAQFGADYLELSRGSTLTFQGTPRIGIADTMPRDNYAWWSGRSDDSVATLTRALDLRGLERATLQFETWYEIEDDYDYAFITVSTDNGATWTTLEGQFTTTYDPQGVNYGHALTGLSGRPGTKLETGLRGQWVEEEVDLSAYAGQTVLLRFWQINDQGFNAPGMLLDNIRIPELDLRDDGESGPGAWIAEGFALVDGTLPQRWELRLVRIAPNGTTVEALNVDAAGRASAELAANEEGVLVIVATTPFTSEPAFYQLTTR